jgi:hypothetical protein
MAENALFISDLKQLSQKAAPAVTSAIRAAANKTGVNFAYLMEQAQAESSFRTDLKAATSSATGLFQFIEKTWLSMVEKHGEKHGMGDLAARVDDPAARDEILGMRKDPKAAAAMAAEFAAENKDYLQKYSGLKQHEIGATELYMAHFMGAGGATNFFKARAENPMAMAADLFPREAAANRNVFYDQETGKARTLAGVYEFFDKKFAVSNQNEQTAPATPLRSPNTPSVVDMMAELTSSLQRQQDSVNSYINAMLGSETSRGDTIRSSAFGANTLVQSPVELMMMAQLDAPYQRS